MAKSGKLKKIKEGAFSRGFALARVSMSAGAKAASHAVGSIFAAEADKPERLKALLVSQIELLARELGQLKGSVMKVGQMLSMYGEHFLPPEANALLKSLQNQSPPLEWIAIEKVLLKQLGAEKLAQLDIDHEPMASASLGQVHAARRKSDGRRLAIKIQYPGVDQAIEGDLKALKSLLSMAKLIPKGPTYDELFREVRQMLHQEVDYTRELALTDEFRQALRDDPMLIVPETFPEFSTKRVITTSFEEGIPVDGAEVLALPQARRDEIAKTALRLYFRELFQLKMVQTDPHFGNYRVRLGEVGKPDQLVLFDFGAVRKFPDTFLKPYYQMVLGAYWKDREALWKGATRLGFLQPEDSPELLNHFADLCFLITEPFSGEYDWGASDLPRRAASKGTQMAVRFRLRSPPREIVFLDRKMGGIFIFLSVLRAKFDAREVIAPYLPARD
jgi:predicted unusual protein kinase regulating ubiquinone biosynthesis (AarF/ABC1/UbiB family)